MQHSVLQFIPQHKYSSTRKMLISVVDKMNVKTLLSHQRIAAGFPFDTYQWRVTQLSSLDLQCQQTVSHTFMRWRDTSSQFQIWVRPATKSKTNSLLRPNDSNKSVQGISIHHKWIFDDVKEHMDAVIAQYGLKMTKLTPVFQTTHCGTDVLDNSQHKLYKDLWACIYKVFFVNWRFSVCNSLQ